MNGTKVSQFEQNNAYILIPILLCILTMCPNLALSANETSSPTIQAIKKQLLFTRTLKSLQPKKRHPATPTPLLRQKIDNNKRSHRMLTSALGKLSLKKKQKSLPSPGSTKKIVSEMKQKTVSSSAIMQRKGTLIEPVSSLGEKMSPGLFFPVTKNTPIRAIHRGTVVYADWFRGYGFLVILNHGDRIFSLYGHNSQLLVSQGEEVRSRQVIAKSGNAGVRNHANGLYFEIRQGYKPENLQKWLVDRTGTPRNMAKAMM